MKIKIIILLSLTVTAQAVRLVGKSNDALEGRVIGGGKAELGEFPHQISLQGQWNGHMCGGSIIGKEWVLTAAHCVDGYNPSYLRVVTGTNKHAEPGATYFVDEFWIHCNYDNPSYHNDIALLHINGTIEFNERTQPIPLPEKPMQAGDDVILSGWGSTILWGDAPDDLQKLTTKFVSHEECSKIYEGSGMLDVGHICTFTREGQGSCHGDSGGPLISNGALVGLVNWGMPCATGVPDAHANVYYYRDWIRKTMSMGKCRSCHCSGSNYPWNRRNKYIKK